MADNSWIKQMDNKATSYQYSTSPSGAKYQMLTGGWYYSPSGKLLKGEKELADYDAAQNPSQPNDQPNDQLSTQLSTQMMSDMGKYSGQLDTHLGTAPTRQENPFSAPTMSQDNRFEAGLAANEKRLSALQDDPNSIQQTAAYKFRVGQGQEALQRQMAAKGMLGSGNRLMELTKYGQDMGSQEYDAQHARLAGLVGQYGQNWTGDKNANTQQFSAQTNAWQGGEQSATQRFGAEADMWGKKAGALADLYRTGVSGASSAASSAASLWGKQPQYSQPISRLSTDTGHFNPGGFTGGSGIPTHEQLMAEFNRDRQAAYRY